VQPFGAIQVRESDRKTTSCPRSEDRNEGRTEDSIEDSIEDRIEDQTDATLPSVVAALEGTYDVKQLILTIVFHPDLTRIAEQAVVHKNTIESPFVLGRRYPLFQCAYGEEPRALSDPHISRRALQFDYNGKQLTLRRFADASRVRLQDEEILEEATFSREQLEKGVPLMLSHCVVLLARMGKPFPRADSRSRVAENQREATREAGKDLLLGHSTEMRALRRQISEVAATDVDVLVQGETGAGKELVAAALHRASARSDGPMVNVNMAAIPSELAAAALFGNARGAYTGADRANPGYFLEAQGGSLFLDEVGDTSVTVQPQLLRALQQREIQAVGGPLQQVDVRVISATDALLDTPSSDFRTALRHRLGAFEVEVPALRDHPEDIGELLRYFLRQAIEQTGSTTVLPHAQSSSPEIAGWANLFFLFQCYRWPGNVRQLSNYAQQIVISSEHSPQLPPSLRAALSTPRSQEEHKKPPLPKRKMSDINESTFRSAMEVNQFEVKRVAAELEVSRGAVYRRIESSTYFRLAHEIPHSELSLVLSESGGDSLTASIALKVSATSLRSRLRELDLVWH